MVGPIKIVGDGGMNGGVVAGMAYRQAAILRPMADQAAMVLRPDQHSERLFYAAYTDTAGNQGNQELPLYLLWRWYYQRRCWAARVEDILESLLAMRHQIDKVYRADCRLEYLVCTLALVAELVLRMCYRSAQLLIGHSH